jgi:hypothetical protein
MQRTFRNTKCCNSLVQIVNAQRCSIQENAANRYSVTLHQIPDAGKICGTKQVEPSTDKHRRFCTANANDSKRGTVTGSLIQRTPKMPVSGLLRRVAWYNFITFQR